MNLNDIFSVFGQLGVKCVVDNNKATFYDAESGLQMEIWEDKTKELSLDNLQMGRYYTLALKSPGKMLRFQLINPRIDGKKDESQVILERVCYGSGEDLHIVDLVPGKNIAFEVKTAVSGRLGEDVIRVESGNYIYFDINNKSGVYDNGYEEGWDLSETEMSEVLNSSKEIQIFSEYYGKIYPELLGTLQSAKSHTKGTAKK